MRPSRPTSDSDHQNCRMINVWFSAASFGNSLQHNRKPCSLYVKELPLLESVEGVFANLHLRPLKKCRVTPVCGGKQGGLRCQPDLVESVKHQTGQGAQNVPTGQVGIRAWKGNTWSRWSRRVLKTPCLEVRARECFKEEAVCGILRALRKATGLDKNMIVCGEL